MARNSDRGRSPWRMEKRKISDYRPEPEQPAVRAMPTRFERLIASLGIGREQWAHSMEVRRFVKKHYQRWYVPEELLAELDMRLTEDMVRIIR